jgi:hypothetical protein
VSAAAVRSLHVQDTSEVLDWDCVDGPCKHDENRTADCPTKEVAYCVECNRVASAVNELVLPSTAIWPCATIKALGS